MYTFVVSFFIIFVFLKCLFQLRKVIEKIVTHFRQRVLGQFLIEPNLTVVITGDYIRIVHREFSTELLTVNPRFVRKRSRVQFRHIKLELETTKQVNCTLFQVPHHRIFMKKWWKDIKSKRKLVSRKRVRNKLYLIIVNYTV